MRLHVLSDIHLETREKHWRAFADRIPSDVGDVLVLAGDIVCFAEPEVPEMLGRLRGKAREVVYVLGNHEHYHGDFGVTKKLAAEVCAAAGVRLLDASAVELAGRRFVGCTLWFPHDQAAQRVRHLMTDFHIIERFEELVYAENHRDVQFLGRDTRPGDIVITHHLPAPGSVAPMFREGRWSTLNPFFLCDCQEIVRRCLPALWIHGHTHVPCEYTLHETRVIANPIGYPGERGVGRLDYHVDV